MILINKLFLLEYNMSGIRNRFMEFSAGPAHYAGFSDYLQRGASIKISWNFFYNFLLFEKAE